MSCASPIGATLPCILLYTLSHNLSHTPSPTHPLTPSHATSHAPPHTPLQHTLSYTPFHPLIYPLSPSPQVVELLPGRKTLRPRAVSPPLFRDANHRPSGAAGALVRAIGAAFGAAVSLVESSCSDGDQSNHCQHNGCQDGQETHRT